MFYTIKENVIYQAYNSSALSDYGTEIKVLPDDYEIDKYIIENNMLVLNPNYKEEQIQKRRINFSKQFFAIGDYGYFRKQPKGYGSAVESLNTAFNVVTIMQKLPADILTFYTAPDFTDETQCTEEWLIANSFKNVEMTTEEFAQFYAQFMTAWNMQEHK